MKERNKRESRGGKNKAGEESRGNIRAERETWVAVANYFMASRVD